MGAVSLGNSPDSDYILERQTFVDGVPTMERRHPLQTHVWADDDIPDQITQDGEIFFHHRCVRCGRDFVQPADGTGWQAAYVELLRIELLADSVTERWVSEECPGRLLTDDCFSRATRKARAPEANRAAPNSARKRP
jgi:hypothetical protein